MKTAITEYVIEMLTDDDVECSAVMTSSREISVGDLVTAEHTNENGIKEQVFGKVLEVLDSTTLSK